MRTVLRAVIVATACVLASACATAPKPQAFNREAHPDIKAIAILPQPLVQVDVVMLNHPGANFGLIGALIAEGDMAAKENVLEEVAASSGFVPLEFFRAELDAALRERGYEPRWPDPVAAKLQSGERARNARIASSVATHPDADAHLELSINLVGYAAAGAGDAQPYRPTVALSAQLLSRDGSQVLFRDSILYHNVFSNRTAITIEPHPDYIYADFDALKGDGERVIEGLRIALAEAARSLAAQL
jgi:hypothetical protein